MNEDRICFGCGAPIRRGYPMITKTGRNVMLCERCKRIWKKANAEKETKAKGADDE